VCYVTVTGAEGVDQYRVQQDIVSSTTGYHLCLNCNLTQLFYSILVRPAMAYLSKYFFMVAFNMLISLVFMAGLRTTSALKCSGKKSPIFVKVGLRARASLLWNHLF